MKSLISMYEKAIIIMCQGNVNLLLVNAKYLQSDEID